MEPTLTECLAELAKAVAASETCDVPVDDVEPVDIDDPADAEFEN